MTWSDFAKKSIDEYYPALFLNKLVSFHSRELLFKVVSLVTFCFGVGSLIVEVVPMPTFAPHVDLVFAAFYFFLALWLVVAALRAFYYSYYFKNIPDNADAYLPLVSFELADLLYRTDPVDLILGFMKSTEGMIVLQRSGVFASDIRDFLSHRTLYTSGDMATIPDTDHLTLTEYAGILFDANKEFADMLFARSIQKQDFLAICDWVIEREVADKKRRRFWSREKLGRIPGIGKAWNYGRLYLLEKYERELPPVTTDQYEVHAVAGTEEIKKLESILIRQREANAFLVSNDIEGKLEIVARLGQMIEEGRVFPELEHKRLFVFDTDLLSASVKSKNEFEEQLMALMNEAAEAGNIILVFLDFPAFINSGQALGSDVVSFMDSYFTSPELQIIALSDVDRYHSVLERNPALMERFDHVIVEDVDVTNTVRILENEIIEVEARFGLFFTYTAITSIVMSADRYVTTGVMPEKAITLLFELAPQMVAHKRTIVRKEDVEELIHLKTGIPVGEVSVAERQTLMNLEQALHKRIIGQDEAVKAIAQAVRRARSGINNPERPMGSFLFLGPTGVGKTETTKALADVFFGSEANIERLDMSEYAGADALPKLIGSYGSTSAGVLTTMVEEHPYGVLLLDEFEKTTTEVMNLFLQILDEGHFSDMTGKKVNACNLLIIATSNAGADLIWDAVKKGDDLSHSREMILDSLIHTNIFKPELLNRFDGVIIFHPLGKEQLEKVARLQLEKLSKRLLERGLKLSITDALVQYVMKFGTDPKFGARPMNRAVQDKVEQVIADKLIRGEAIPGSEIILNEKDLTI